MEKIFGWIIVLLAGFFLMAYSYFSYQYFPAPEEWKNAFMYLGDDKPEAEAEQFDYAERDIIYLPVRGRARAFEKLIDSRGAELLTYYQLFFREKVFFYENLSEDFTEEMLERGRLPKAGASEAVGGGCTENDESVIVGGIEYEIVGRLKKNIGVFADSYLIDGDIEAGERGIKAEEIHKAYVVRLTEEQRRDKEAMEVLGDAFAKWKFMAYFPMIRPERGAFNLYFLGMVLQVTGGIFVFYNVFLLLGGRIRNNWLQPAFAEMYRYRKLFMGCHLVYFGLVLLFFFIAYLSPEVQMFLSVAVHRQIESGTGPLAVAGKAYGSGNILLAATVTFLINFLLGSVLCLTVPSLIIPGSGILIGLLRAVLWGLLLSPAMISLSGAMLAHSFTLLLEGEGYVLAVFFGLLVPVYLFRRSEGEGAGRRYLNALMINVKGNLVVAVVLAIAAIYEAVEVILMMKFR